MSAVGQSHCVSTRAALGHRRTIDTQQAGQTDRAPGFDRQYSSQEAAIRAAMMLDLTVRIKVPANRASGLNYLCLSAFH